MFSSWLDCYLSGGTRHNLSALYALGFRGSRSAFRDTRWKQILFLLSSMLGVRGKATLRYSQEGLSPFQSWQDACHNLMFWIYHVPP